MRDVEMVKTNKKISERQRSFKQIIFYDNSVRHRIFICMHFLVLLLVIIDIVLTTMSHLLGTDRLYTPIGMCKLASFAVMSSTIFLR